MYIFESEHYNPVGISLSISLRSAEPEQKPISIVYKQQGFPLLSSSLN